MVKDLISKLEIELAAFAELLMLIEPLQGALFKIPPVVMGAEGDEIEKIEPEPVVLDRLSVELGMAFNDLYIKKPFSQKSSRRYPGVVQFPVNESSQKLVDQIQRINQLKSEIQTTVVTNYSTRGDRFRAMHEACPGGMTMHIYRLIHLLDQRSVNSIRFTWQKKEVVTVPNKQQLLEQIAAVYAVTEPQDQLPLLQLLDAINKTTETKLRVRRPVKVQPAANVVMADAKQTLNAPLPIVVIQNEIFKMAPVPVYDASVKRKPRSDRKPNIILGTFNGFQIESTN